jgi:calcineurin-like phosphoesterase family protein
VKEVRRVLVAEVFFISDTHFGHRGIISFESTKPFRPFETIEEHDAELVSRWNADVRPKDIVWHLGDFCFGRRNLHIAAELNGKKRLIMGNHDIYGADEYLKYFEKLYGCVEYKGMLLSHMPVHPNQLEKRYYMNVHGHLHTNHVMKPLCKVQRDYRYFNASCEQINLTPIPLDEIHNSWAQHKT